MTNFPYLPDQKPLRRLTARDAERERQRQERLKRLLDSDKRLSTGAKLFTEAEYQRATRLARQTMGVTQ